jgi:hypothetical protein
MRKLWHLGLESYQSRYTMQLTEWSRRVFERRGIQYEIVPGNTLDSSEQIVVGQVLDAHGRSYFSMSQMMNLVKLMREGAVTGEDVILFEDMFSPGMESLPYILNQIPENMRPKVWVRCLAQTIDPDDFVHVWGMSRWMSHYEHMCNEFVTGVLATNEEMVAHMRIAGWRAPLYNISGLSFGKAEVLERVGGAAFVRPFEDRIRRVGFSSRFDQEKNPHFFMDIIEMVYRDRSDVKFAVYSGSQLRSNDPTNLARARMLQAKGILDIYENLGKNQYYELLNDTRVLLNTALQDWTSNTGSEADTLGANLLFPAYRSFPEVFANDHTRMYVPWSKEDAVAKLYRLLESAHPNMGKVSDWNDGAIDRMIDIIQGNGEQWRRDSVDYRRHTVNSKY